MVRALILALVVTGCAAAGPGARPAPSAGARIDHVIVGVADLDAGVDEIERLTGVRATIGGVHPGRGTRNALMSLGEGTYLEILALDPAQAVENEEIRALRSLGRPATIGWAVSAGDAAELQTALAQAGIGTSQPQPGSRAKPDGSVLRWVTFGFDALDDLSAPFFIVWEDPELHPSRTSPGGCRLAGLQIEGLNGKAIAGAIAALRLDVSAMLAERERMRLLLACPTGAVRL